MRGREAGCRCEDEGPGIIVKYVRFILSRYGDFLGSESKAPPRSASCSTFFLRPYVVCTFINLSQYNFYVSLLLSRRLSFSLEKANSDLTKQEQRRMLMDLELSQR